MQFGIRVFFNPCLIFWNIFIFTNAKPMVGENVQQVPKGKFEFVVALVIRSSKDPHYLKQICTGALVSNRDVLTSDHCMTRRDYRYLEIIVGSRDLRNGIRKTPLYWLNYVQWAQHVGITPDFEANDIAMIRLKENITNTIQPGKLSNLSNKDLNHLQVILVGWGKKADGQKPMILEIGNVKLISPMECENKAYAALGKQLYFEPIVFCTYSKPYILIHDGDSGSPVIYKNEIIGISKGTCPYDDMKDKQYKMNVHIGIYFYRDFILGFIHNVPDVF